MVSSRHVWIAVACTAVSVAGCSSSGTVRNGSTSSGDAASSISPLDYKVDLTPLENDRFDVTLTVDDLTDADSVYQFASTAPGSYEVMDIGRYVQSFSALDASGAAIPVEQVSVNQWRISRPRDVRSIRYAIAETWDTEVNGAPVMMMGGTSMEADHVLFNANAVLGFPSSMQARPLRIKLDRPSDWVVGTALEQDEKHRYLAKNYDHAVDSPILLGRLTKASLDVRGSKVDVYTYSMTGKVTSTMVLNSIREILNAASDFLKGLPVDRYTFLFHFGDPLNEYANDKGYLGAWEHSYSSEYILDEANFKEDLKEQIPSFVAHEFFHVVTPLNIHSEIIEQFNFVTPVPSEHLWLYEGTTEWVAQTMQLRGGLIDMDEYLDRIGQKLEQDDGYDKSMSLSELSLQAYTDKGQEEYPNIYERGAVVAALLDLRLLYLSHGTKGLREVLLELAQKYGPDKAFNDATFFDEFTGMTYPQIGQFFDDYVKDSKPLPVGEYFDYIGVRYAAELPTGQMVPTLGLDLGVPDGKIRVMGTDSATAACGFRVGDAIDAVDGKTLTFGNAHELFGRIGQLGAGIPFRMTVLRGEERVDVTCTKQLQEYVARHVFVADSDPSPSQLALRQAWMSNLD